MGQFHAVASPGGFDLLRWHGGLLLDQPCDPAGHVGYGFHLHVAATLALGHQVSDHGGLQVGRRRQAEQLPAVALGHPAGLDQVQGGLGEVEEAQLVGGGAAFVAEGLAGLLGGEAQGADGHVHGPGFLQRRQVLALVVLAHGLRPHGGVVEVDDAHGDAAVGWVAFEELGAHVHGGCAVVVVGEALAQAAGEKLEGGEAAVAEGELHVGAVLQEAGHGVGRVVGRLHGVGVAVGEAPDEPAQGDLLQAGCVGQVGALGADGPGQADDVLRVLRHAGLVGVGEHVAEPDPVDGGAVHGGRRGAALHGHGHGVDGGCFLGNSQDVRGWGAWHHAPSSALRAMSMQVRAISDQVIFNPSGSRAWMLAI